MFCSKINPFSDYFHGRTGIIGQFEKIIVDILGKISHCAAEYWYDKFGQNTWFEAGF